MAPVGDLLAVGAVALGATMQRATGLGFALVAAPFLVVILGPFSGVTLANLLSAVINLIVLCVTARALQRRVAVQMIAGVVLALPLGVWVVRELPGRVLLVGIGLITAGSVTWVAVGRSMPFLRHRGGAVASGFASGFFNTTAGTGGPPLAVYAVSTGWEHRSFVPTVQLVGLVTNVLSLAAKGAPVLSWRLLLACGAAMLAGIGGGHYLERWLPETATRRWVLALALTGSVIAIGKGVAAW
ncbi:TSUP family transporter [Micromonospora terminaliae]|uniref:Probable membrane transporter protein n=1 Tax=Micromonospora terminaliae TaxID=1914461 RepID=A0AAJ2ZM16_9ACTN|nr:sulfite exporter TauE/SafE family protein [Micromonospora terminaliae]NES31658.1 sulfite exporter TauE/SafE family protein [Micromonospora terminaliae]QGL46159.1 TSUP family transporter [Micromonospora terminaliae]